jgi:hypothetical protein
LGNFVFVLDYQLAAATLLVVAGLFFCGLLCGKRTDLVF